MDVTISCSGADGVDLPAWLQAAAAFVALGVTVFQWWSTRQQALQERKARQMSGFAVLANAHAALRVQGERLAQVRIDSGEEAMCRYARSILQAGFDLTERTVLGIDISGLPIGGVEAVMSGQSAVAGMKMALEDMVKRIDEAPEHDATAQAIKDAMMHASVQHFLISLGQLDVASKQLKEAIARG